MNYNKEPVNLTFVDLIFEKYLIDTIATYECNAGYSLSGPESNTCHNSATHVGNWEHDLPVCQSK